MAEVGTALAALAAMLVLATLRRALDWDGLLRLGAVCVALGSLGSTVAGLAYHRALRRALLCRGNLPHRWYWDPTAYHGRLAAAQRPQVLPWFYAGAGSCAVVLFGCSLWLLAAVAAG